MNNTNFTICKANQEQREYVFERVIIKDEEERKKAVVYVATDSDNRIIGRTVIKEKDVPAPISGKYWYIENLFVHPQFRRKGIASALVAEIMRAFRGMGVELPTRSNRYSCKTLSNLDCRAGGSNATSSRKMVPSPASSNLPFWV